MKHRHCFEDTCSENKIENREILVKDYEITMK